MQTVLNVDPNEVRAAASRWQMIGADLGAGGAPPVSLATSWPSAAATAGIHGQAAAATEASPPDFGEQLREGSALVGASSRGLQTR